MKKTLIGILALTGLVGAQQSAEDYWRGIAPHDVPSCDMPARAARNPESTAPCHCVGMVAETQDALGRQCWQDHGPVPLPDDPEESLRIRAMILGTGDVSESLTQCLEGVPDHCDIVARSPRFFGVPANNTCRTSCRPERCGCKDGSCPAHGEGAY